MAITKAEFEQRYLDLGEASQAALEAIQVAQEAIQVAVEAANSAGGSFSETYLFQAVVFDTEGVEVMRGPAGKTGIIRSISVFNITEQFGTAGDAHVIAGTVADPNGYVIGGALGLEPIAGALSPALTPGALGNVLPADTDFQITMVEDTSAPVGISDVQITVTWS